VNENGLQIELRARVDRAEVSVLPREVDRVQLDVHFADTDLTIVDRLGLGVDGCYSGSARIVAVAGAPNAISTPSARLEDDRVNPVTSRLNRPGRTHR
jgi:hypothetical protein